MYLQSVDIALRCCAAILTLMEPPRRGHFATTRWSVVLAASAGTSSEAVRQALSTLCETYWYPLYAFLRSRGYRAEGEHCVAITCRAGFILGPDGECQKRKEPPKPVVRAEPKPQQPASSSPAPRGGGKCFAFNGKQFCE